MIAMREERKRISVKEKMMIFRKLLENKVQLGELSEKYQIHPNVIYNWKKILFEKENRFLRTEEQKPAVRQKKKISRLEAKLKDKDSLISEIVEDNIRLKKI